MPGERRLVSIKSLLESIGLNIASIAGIVSTKEVRKELTYTNSLVSVSNVSTLVLNANPNRRYLCIRRGTTIGRVFVLLGSGTATTTNGELLRENQFIETEEHEYYTGAVNAISVGSSKILYVTEGFDV